MPEAIITSNIDDMRQALEQLPDRITLGVMRDVAQYAERQALERYRRTTRTWDHMVEFESQVRYTSNTYSVTVGTEDEVYGFVDRGTRGPYPIVPKRPGYPLRFRTGYKAKTAVGILGSTGGGAAGPEVRAWAVMHPGIKARGFTEMIFREVGHLSFQRAIKSLREQIRRYIRVRGQRPV